MDQPRRTCALRRQKATEHDEPVLISTDSSTEEGESLEQCLTRKAAGKHPVSEGPSQKKKAFGPLRTGGALIIHEEESGPKGCRGMTGLIDVEEETEEQPLVHK
jgi:hypothetical protein